MWGYSLFLNTNITVLETKYLKRKKFLSFKFTYVSENSVNTFTRPFGNVVNPHKVKIKTKPKPSKETKNEKQKA